MLDILLDALIDTLKIIPFLFIVFFIMELLEHKISVKNKNVLKKAGKTGPIFGSILGSFPQCGFSVAATNLYASRIITMGTLIAIYLSTSDEMLPILISSSASIKLILSIILTKIIIGMVCGIIIDLIFRKKENEKIHEICEHDHCDCEHSILKSSIKHTLNITLFIFIMSLLLNALIYFIGEENISKLFLKGSIFCPFISSVIGLIPNCASSVIITELYLNSAITYGSMISGLLTGSGVALMALFKVNKDKKEDFKILGILYFIGVLSGIIIDLIINLV